MIRTLHPIYEYHFNKPCQILSIFKHFFCSKIQKRFNCRRRAISNRRISGNLFYLSQSVVVHSAGSFEHKESIVAWTLSSLPASFLCVNLLNSINKRNYLKVRRFMQRAGIRSSLTLNRRDQSVTSAETSQHDNNFDFDKRLQEIS